MQKIWAKDATYDGVTVRDTALINGRFRLKDIAYVWWEFQVLLKNVFTVSRRIRDLLR